MAFTVSIDGILQRDDHATISVLDRGFLYGDSVFEVMRTYGGRPFGEQEHLERLARSCDKVLIRMPASIEAISGEIRAALAAARNDESYVRVIITRGEGPLTYDPTTATGPRRLVIIAPLPPQPEEHYAKGVKVALVHASRPTDDARAAGSKASNYLSNLLAVHEAKERGGYEAIILAPGGEVLEGASSNVFALKGGVLRTPPISSRILAGITREVVMRAAAKLDVPVKEGVMYPRDLYDADEVMLTSTLREVMPVVAVDGVTIGNGVPGSVTTRLRSAFRGLVLDGDSGRS